MITSNKLRSAMSDSILYSDASGREMKVSYKNFLLSILERENLPTHLELISCITKLDKVYPVLYYCFREDFGSVDFVKYPKMKEKFSPVLFTLCVDFINNNGLVIKREYTEKGVEIAGWEILLDTEIHYTHAKNSVDKTIYYRDFINKLIDTENDPESMLDLILIEAQTLNLIGDPKIEVNENLMLMFLKFFHGVVKSPLKIKGVDPVAYAKRIQLMFSSVGVSACIEHVKSISNLEQLLPELYTKVIIEEEEVKPIIHETVTIHRYDLSSIVILIVVILAIIGLVSMCK